ncbi:hypothetical protein PRIPAC_74366 [Pristionchus pacificus]|uniref:Uncharacterized protein n=1 Tax=Pristionchus pacificus TaxID=54126 RepID=A0A2A6BFG5_PRIPA|nr:hypothetical protein PRIPAC_74366 [Pristionchus pacificus]|eukprot:PDM64634.1 hypothetical protein PRIPAC_52890 [Pristionchus pacificus]
MANLIDLEEYYMEMYSTASGYWRENGHRQTKTVRDIAKRHFNDITKMANEGLSFADEQVRSVLRQICLMIDGIAPSTAWFPRLMPVVE